jgi:hypothetical protein
LQLATGVSAGVDLQGDMLLTFMPASKPDSRPQLGIWLPCGDYEQLITALGGTSGDGISAVTIAGEDLLVAHDGAWALVMDPDQRDRMKQLLDSRAALDPRIATWKDWIDSNNVTAMILPHGIHALWAKVAAGQAVETATANPATSELDSDLLGAPSYDADELFGAPTEETAAADDVRSALFKELQAQLKVAPQLAAWVSETEAVLCGVRVDAEGNAVAGIRFGWRAGTSLWSATSDQPVGEPPTLYQAGDYIVSGAGRVPGILAAMTASTYARLVTNSLRDDIHVQFEDEVAVRFQQAVESAAADVSAAAVLTRPGEKQDGAYSNAFLAVRVKAADLFEDQVAEVVRIWNEMNQSEQDESKLVFEIEAVQVGSRPAKEYSIDMASMERLFGPGGKLRLLVVPVDKQTVLLAAATAAQAAPSVEVIAQGQPIPWDERTNRLLPDPAAWRVLVDPNGYTRWMKRQLDAMLGPVIGSPMVRDFPASPPVGIAGGFGPQHAWADIAMPADTIRGAGEYLQQR